MALATGQGRRLRSLTETLPKPMCLSRDGRCWRTSSTCHNGMAPARLARCGRRSLG